jgi:hypothetical protein
MFDGPVPILCTGITLEIILGLILLRSGRGAVFVAMCAVALLTLAGIGVERLIVTDVKRVKASLEDIRAAIEANDVRRALDYVAPEAVKLRPWAEDVTARVRFTEVKIKDLKVTVDHVARPPRAEARFFGIASFDSAEVPYHNYGAEFTLEFRPSDRGWLLARILEEKPLGGGAVTVPIDRSPPR